MFYPESRARIWLCTEPTDMRKSFTGLSALVKNRLSGDPLSGDLYVFINRRKNQMKVLYFERSGFCVWSKKLEQGQFVVRPSGPGKKPLDWVGLKLLLEGIEIKKARKYKRFCYPE